MKTGIKIVYNKLLNGWYVVRGPHQTPLAGRFATKSDAKAYLNRKGGNYILRAGVDRRRP